jgi:hypothetical protein
MTPFAGTSCPLPSSTLHAARPLEVEAALGEGRGPFSGQTNALPGGATNPMGLGTLATACSANASAYRLPRFPEA